MLLKRTLVLAAGVLLFIAGFIVYFDYRDARMEGLFRQERQAHGIADGTVLTTRIVSSPVPASPPSPPPATTVTAAPPAGTTDAMPPTPAQNTTSAPTPAPAPTPADTDINASSVPPAAAPDTNVIIGPLPPPAVPDGAPAPAPSSPTPTDTNSSGPTPSPPSTMVYPGGRNLALFMLAAYTPLPAGGARAQAEPSAPITITLPAPPTAPVTNTPAPAASTVTTNAASIPAEPETTRPVPVEASVIVLGYHQFVGPGQTSRNIYCMRQEVFAQEMKYLHDNGYHVVPLSDVIRFVKHEIGLPPNSVAITIDDGYKSAILWAAPVLKRYGYPWTFFIYPDFITTGEGRNAASWKDLLALQADGVDIECHSMTHPQLTKHHQKVKGVWHNFSPEEYDQWLTNETAGAKALLEQKMGKPITCFAYPYGDYNKEVEAKVIAAGFDAIFTVANNPVHNTTDKFSMGRYIITRPVERSFAAYLRQGALGLAEMDPAPGATITNPRPIITVVLGYAGTIDPQTIETQVRDFGEVRHDFDPKTSTLRLYLPRDLIQPVNFVNIRAKDAQTGQVMVASWHFNYQPPVPSSVHPPIGATTPSPVSATAGIPTTNQADPSKAPTGAP